MDKIEALKKYLVEFDNKEIEKWDLDPYLNERSYQVNVWHEAYKEGMLHIVDKETILIILAEELKQIASELIRKIPGVIINHIERTHEILSEMETISTQTRNIYVYQSIEEITPVDVSSLLDEYAKNENYVEIAPDFKGETLKVILKTGELWLFDDMLNLKLEGTLLIITHLSDDEVLESAIFIDQVKSFSFGAIHD